MDFSKPKEWFNQVKGFLKEVKIEGRNVSWPSRPQLTAATIVVIVVVMIVASFLGLVDYIFAFLFRLIGR